MHRIEQDLQTRVGVEYTWNSKYWDITEFPCKFDLNCLTFQICVGQNGICRQELMWNLSGNVLG